MSEMVERVAKAIYAEFERRPDYAQAQMNVVLAEELAKAAIEALREPTEKMLENGFAMDSMSGHPLDIWQAMIAEALPSPPEN